jgi:hypothetical protein
MPQANIITNMGAQKIQAVCSLCHICVMSGLTEYLSRRTWLGWTRSLSTGLPLFIFISKTLWSSYITTIRISFIVLSIMWGFLSRVKFFLFEPWKQKGREDIAPLVLNLVTRWVCLFSPTSRPLCLRDTRPQYLMNRRLSGHQDWSRHFGEGRNIFFTANWTTTSRLRRTVPRLCTDCTNTAAVQSGG